MTDSNERPETWKPVPLIEGCSFSGYEASDKGGYRSVDRVAGNRHLKGKVLATRRHDDGYRLVNIRCDSTDPEHNRVHTFAAHKVTLWTFAGPPQPGQEARHSPRGPSFNWWPEGFEEGGWGTKSANHADQVAAGTAVMPEYPCKNAGRCGGTVRTENRRCRSCVAEVGRDTVVLLNAGMGLLALVERFGLKGDDWLYRLAVEYGYTGTKAEARAQRPRGLQRVTLARAEWRCHAS